MKKFLLTTIIALLSISVFASTAIQSANETTGTHKRNLPIAQRAKLQFIGDIIKANFSVTNSESTAYYTAEGALIGTGKAILIDKLPIEVKRNIAKEFTDFTVLEAIEFADSLGGGYLITAESNNQSVLLKVDNEKIEVLKNAWKN